MGLAILHVRQEQLGCSHNRMWRVIKQEALRQIDQGIASAEDIDPGWMLGFGADIGPCGMMDRVGLATLLAVEEVYHAHSGDEADCPPALPRPMVAEQGWG